MTARVLYLVAAAGLAAIAYGGRELVTAEPLDPTIWPYVFALATAACIVAAVRVTPGSWLMATVATVGLAIARIFAVILNVADGHVYQSGRQGWLSLGVWVLVTAMAAGFALHTRPPRSWAG